jgi:hypothetical protein
VSEYQYYEFLAVDQPLDARQLKEMRALFDKVQLDVAYQPAEHAIDVTLTLYDPEQNDGTAAARESAEDWSVPPAGIEPAHMASEANALSAELRGQRAGLVPGRMAHATAPPNHQL